MSKTSASFAAALLLLLGMCPRLLAQATTQPAAPTGAVNPPLRPWQFDDDDDDEKAPPTTTAANGGRYFFGLLDSRSSYGRDFFPDSFIGPEFDAERQVELDYAHTAGHGSRDDEIDGEVDWTLLGQLSIAAEGGWDSSHVAGPAIHDDDDGERGSATGLENVDVAAYHPIFQFVSDDQFFDYTAALRLDVGIPTRTPASGGDATLTPYLGQLLRLGDHLSFEGWTGWQFTIAPHQPTDLIYGGLLGYAISHSQLPVPLTESITPMLEFDGQSPLSGPGQDALVGVAGFEADFRSIGDLDPQFQLGYEFPLDQGGRDELQWGIIAELYFQF